jgi:hypothetical protein
MPAKKRALLLFVRRKLKSMPEDGKDTLGITTEQDGKVSSSSGSQRTFHSDPEIANAWNRLVEETQTERDVQLLKHEYFESRFEGTFKTNYRTAHGAANRAGRTSGLE